MHIENVQKNADTIGAGRYRPNGDNFPVGRRYGYWSWGYLTLRIAEEIEAENREDAQGKGVRPSQQVRGCRGACKQPSSVVIAIR